MVKLTVYGSSIDIDTQCILILLEELQLKYNIIELNLLKEENKEPKYLELNPFGQVPTIIYDNHTIFESRTILRYIAKNNLDNDEQNLNVNIDMWLEVESQHFNPYISKIINEKTLEKSDDTENLDKLKNTLEIYNKQLCSFKYLAGDCYSIADIAHIPYLNLFIKCGYKYILKEYPFVYKWIKQIFVKESTQTILNLNVKKN